MGMNETVNETPQAKQVDKRVVLAIIKALARTRKVVVPLEVVEEELAKIIEDYDERERVMLELMEAIDTGVVRDMYLVRGRLVISPRELSEEGVQTLQEVAKLYEFKAYDGYDRETEVDNVIHNLIRMWGDPCFGTTNAARAAYILALEYGLGTKEVMNMWGKDGYGTAVYSIKDSILVSETLTPCFCGEEEENNDCCEEGGDCGWWEFVEPSETQNNTQGEHA
jgi:hypothetical protein